LVRVLCGTLSIFLWFRMCPYDDLLGPDRYNLRSEIRFFE
jgi:hypothetical protein